MKAKPGLRRSVMITPGDDEALLRKATKSRADVTVIDWEDGVFESRKEVARSVTAQLLATEDWSAHEIAIRVNGVDTPEGMKDIEAVAALPVHSLRLPMVRGVDDVLHAMGILDDIEKKVRPAGLPPLKVWVSIETARALIEVESIAKCHSRMSAITLGQGDLGIDLGVKRLQLGSDRELGFVRYEYVYAEGRVVAAARAYGLDPINTGFVSFRDLEGTSRQARYSAQLGFAGCMLFSPKQIDAVNAAFSPSEDDLRWARSVLDSFETSTREKAKTVVVVKNEMTDGPLVLNARQILAVHAATQETKPISAR